MQSGRTWFPWTGLALALLAPGANAQTFFTASPQGDWFDPASWSTGAAPTAAEDAVIDNGATATATGGGPLEAGSLAVGSHLDPARPLGASGALDASDVDLSVTGDLSIGGVVIDPPSPASVSGSVSIDGGSTANGDVIVGGTTRVGVVSGNRASAATGTLDVAGDFETHVLLNVGTTSDTEAVDGQMQVGSALRVAAPPDTGGARTTWVQVGRGATQFADPVATSTGSLSVGGDLDVVADVAVDGRLEVGVAFERGDADGSLQVAGDVGGFERVYIGVGLAGGDSGGIAKAVGDLVVDGVLAFREHIPATQSPSLRVGVSEPGVTAGFLNGTADATGTAQIGSIVGQVRTLVGVSQVGDASGTLTAGSGLLEVTVGQSWGDWDANGVLIAEDVRFARVGNLVGGSGTATGTATIGFAAGASIGDVSGDGNGHAVGRAEVGGFRPDPTTGISGVAVGSNSRGNSTSDGQLLVRAGMDVYGVNVGYMVKGVPGPSFPPTGGSALGLLESNGDVQVAGAAHVGFAGTETVGQVDGTWLMHQGTYTGGTLTVGQGLGTGSAVGRVHLDRMLVDLSSSLILGDGATLAIDIGGILRGTEYSSIDAAAATLAGALEVDFTAPTPNRVYDLIISEALDGIAGNFASVSASGLAPGQSLVHRITTVDYGGGAVEVFQIEVVPEPGTGALVAIGLVALGARRRHARATGKASTSGAKSAGSARFSTNI